MKPLNPFQEERRRAKAMRLPPPVIHEEVRLDSPSLNGAVKSLKRDDARKVMEAMGFNPIEEAIIRYRDPKSNSKTRDTCLSLLADRYTPRLKSVEVSGSDGDEIKQVTINITAPASSPSVDNNRSPTITGRLMDAVVDDEDQYNEQYDDSNSE